MLVGHHWQMDGISLMQALYSFSDNIKLGDFPFLKPKPISPCSWICLHVLAPVAAIRSAFWFLSRPNQYNCIHPHTNFLKGLLRARISAAISMTKAKALAKRLGVTFNDLTLGLLSTTLRQYFAAKQDKTKEVTVCVPFTFNSIPEQPSDFEFANRFASISLFLGLFAGFEAACQHAHEQMTTIKSSLIPFGYYATQIAQGFVMPVAALLKAVDLIGHKYSFVFSNVPGFIRPVTFFGGHRAKRFVSLISALGVGATGINVVSIDKRAQFAVTSDETQITDIDFFVRLLDSEIKAQQLEYDSAEEGHD